MVATLPSRSRIVDATFARALQVSLLGLLLQEFVNLVYLHSVEAAFSAFSRLHRINNLRRFKPRDGFDSHPRRQLFSCI